MKNTQEQRVKEYFVYTENDLDFEYSCYLFEKDYGTITPQVGYGNMRPGEPAYLKVVEGEVVACYIGETPPKSAQIVTIKAINPEDSFLALGGF